MSSPSILIGSDEQKPRIERQSFFMPASPRVNIPEKPFLTTTKRLEIKQDESEEEKEKDLYTDPRINSIQARRKESIYYRSHNFERMWNEIFDGGELEELFVQHCRDSLCVENILFYRRATSYKFVRDTTSRKFLANEIWAQFLSKDAEYEININAKLWQEVKANVEKADIDCFDKVVTEVKKMVVRDSILKFTNTNTYKDHKERKTAMERLLIETKNDNGLEVELILQKMMADNFRQPFLLDFNRPNNQGVTPLYLAAYGNKCNAMFHMLSVLGSKADLNVQIEPHGGTALHVASSFGFDRCVCLLLFYGASVDIPNVQGQTPKDEAKGPCVDTYDLFLKKGKQGLATKYPDLFPNIATSTVEPSTAPSLGSRPVSQGEPSPLRIFNVNKGVKKTPLTKEQQALQTILAHAIEVNEKFQLAKQAQNYVPSEMDIEFELLLGSILSTKGLMKNVDLLSLPSKPALKKVNTITREEEKVERRPPSALKPTATIERKKNFTTSDPPKATPSDIEKERELARLRLEMLGFASSEEEEIIKDDNTFPLRTRMKDRPKSSKREKGKTSRPNSPRKVSNTNHPTEKPYLELIDPEKPKLESALLENLFKKVCESCESGNYMALTELLTLHNNEIKSVVNQINEKGLTPLYIASRAGHRDVVQLLLTIPQINLNYQVLPHQATALHAAGFNGHGKIVVLLLEAGADHNITNALGNTAKEEARGDAVGAYENYFNESDESYLRDLLVADILDKF